MASLWCCGPLFGLRGSRSSQARAVPAGGSSPRPVLLGTVLLGRHFAEPSRRATASEADLRPQLVQFLVKQAGVNPKIVDYMTMQLKIESVYDFVNYFTEADYEAGVQEQIMANVAPFNKDLSAPSSELQRRRLRAAWTRAKSTGTWLPTADKAARLKGRPCRVRKSAEGVIIEAVPQCMDSMEPTAIGYGIISESVRSCSYDFLFAAVELSIREPWRVMDVDRSSCSIEHCQSYIQRKMRLSSSGETIVERVTVNNKTSEFTFRKCSSNGLPGKTVHVLAIHTPLVLELYKCSARSGLRVHCAAPCARATGLFASIIELATRLQRSSAEMLASRPIAGMSRDAIWGAMTLAAHNPAECGLVVDAVNVRHMDGYMQCTMRNQERPGAPTVVENVRVVEGEQEITYRPVVNGREAEEEGVFALRSNPLRFEIFCRHSENGARLNWQAPRGPAISIFKAMLFRVSVRATDPHAGGEN